MRLSDFERRFVNTYQGGFPILEQPFRAVAADIGCSQGELLDGIQRLLDVGILSRFGPLYDALRLGGGLTLAAMAVPETRFDAVAAQVNAFDAVAHNYRREHELNMWFVLATETADEIDATLASISRMTGLEVYNFPKQREFYIGLWLELGDQGSVTTIPVPESARRANGRIELDAVDRRIIRETQSGLSLTPCPWKTVAARAECSIPDVKLRMNRMLDGGVIRRVGVVPNHYRLGLKANGMTVWDVADDCVEKLGKTVGRLGFVSHCYLRPRRLPIWGYNLFAMVHGRDRDEVYEKARWIEQILGDRCRAHEILFSSAVLKKTGLRMAA